MLTAKQVETLTAPGRYLDDDGLLLQVISPTNRSWIFRYQVNHKVRMLGLGSARHVTLKQARERARAARLLLVDGKDPIAEKKARKTAALLAEQRTVTFTQAAQRYYDSQRHGWKSAKHAANWLDSIRLYAEPVLGRLPVSAIDRPAVLAVLTPIWTKIPDTANRLRGRIENILDFARFHGWRGETENPARWRGNLAFVLPPVAKVKPSGHYSTLPYMQVPELLARLEQDSSIDRMAADALEFLTLCASRRGEVLGATWAEIQLDAKIWEIPGPRMKEGKAHRVPLSDRAVALLERQPRTGDLVFARPDGRPIGPEMMNRLLRTLGYAANCHGMRSAFADWAAERTSMPREVAEAALSHATGSAVERIYRRSDFFEARRRLMQQWSDFCTTPVGAADNVTPIRPLSHG